MGLAMAPDLLRMLAGERRVALVSGTNGKTTTTRLLATALAGAGEAGHRPVATSTAGANLPPGIVAALAAADAGAPAVLEVDEAYLAAVADAVRPEAVVLLNLSRDQLDRVSEVRALATRWRAAMTRMADATVVANADDPLVAWAASAAASPRWVAAGQRWRQDATGCPACDGRIEFTVRGGGWRCQRCGLSRPRPDAAVDGDALVLADGRRFPVALGLPGRFNVANAAMAAVAAAALGVDVPDALAAMTEVAEVEGRFAVVPVGEVSGRLLLAKNPAGWAELLDLVEGRATPVVLGINAQVADGRDPSWLWDVPFERLRGRSVVATGERADDLAVRLRHAGVAHRVVRDQLQALCTAAAGSSGAGHAPADGATGGQVPGATPAVDYVGNYTAFQQLRRQVAGSRRGATPVVVVEHPATAVVAGHRPDGAARYPGLPRRGSAAGTSALRVVVVHPDLLGTYGDGGNGLVLANRAAWRGIDAELVLVHADDEVPVSGDVYLLGGGEDGPQVQAADLLGGGQLRRAVDHGATVLAVCAGFQVAGTSFPGPDNQPRRGLGLLDVTTTKRRAPRAVGELLAVPLAGAGGGDGDLPAQAGLLLADAGPLTGFENHGGGTTLGRDVRPLATVVAGIGNDGTGTEGAWAGRVIGTYLHGPVLARNPGLADALLVMATGVTLAPLDDREEQALRRQRIEAFPRRVRAGLLPADEVDGGGRLAIRRFTAIGGRR